MIRGMVGENCCRGHNQGSLVKKGRVSTGTVALTVSFEQVEFPPVSVSATVQKQQPPRPGPKNCFCIEGDQEKVRAGAQLEAVRAKGITAIKRKIVVFPFTCTNSHLSNSISLPSQDVANGAFMPTN